MLLGSGYGRSPPCRGFLPRKGNQKTQFSVSHFVEKEHKSQDASLPMRPEQLQQQMALESPIDIFQRIFLGPTALQRSLGIRQRLYAYQDGPKLRTPIPVFNRLRQFEDDAQAPLVISLDLLRYQIKNCVAPADVTRVIMVAFRHEEGTRLLSTSSLQHVMYRKLTEGGPEWATEHVLICLNLFVRKLLAADLDIMLSLLWVGLKAAASCYNLTAVTRFLKLYGDGLQKKNTRLSREEVLFLLIALKEGFNRTCGKLQSREELLDILFRLCGDSDLRYSPLEPHTPIFQDSETMTAWIECLASLKYGDVLFDEWTMARNVLLKAQAISIGNNKERKLRTDVARLFVLALLHSGAGDRAWQVFATMEDLDFDTDRLPWRAMAMNTAPIPPLGKRMRKLAAEKFAEFSELVLRTLTTRLERLEDRLGVQWVQGAFRPGEYSHRLIGGSVFEEAMDELGSSTIDSSQWPATHHEKLFEDETTTPRRRSRKSSRVTEVRASISITNRTSIRGSNSTNDALDNREWQLNTKMGDLGQKQRH